MEAFESRLDGATTLQEILGAAVSVVDKEGIVYQKFSGHQTLGISSPPVDQNTTFALGDAGTFITHIAALQCVDNGFVRLDDPIRKYLPELETPSIVKRKITDDSDEERDLLLHWPAPDHEITLRDLLSNTSGLDDDDELIQVRTADITGRFRNFPSGREPSVDKPGNRWSYSANSGWIVRLIERVTHEAMSKTVQDLIFDILGMTSSVYLPCDNAEITSRLLQPVERGSEGLEAIAAEDLATGGVVTSIKDMSLLLTALVSPICSILKPESVEGFFGCNLGSIFDVHREFRLTKWEWTAYMGIPKDMAEPPICYSFGGLLVGGELPLSKMPPGTVTWNGVPNLAWALNKDYGLGMIWVTQFAPEDDEICVDIAMEFFRGAWTKFTPIIDTGSKVEQILADEAVADSGFETQTPSDNDLDDTMDFKSSHSDSTISQPLSPAIAPVLDNPRKRKSEEMDTLMNPFPSQNLKRHPPTKPSLEDDLDDDMDLVGLA